jgi:hypothetical protein
MPPGIKDRSDRRHGCGPHCIRSLSPQLNEDEAVEAEDQGLADQDIPVTVDGMTDGWMQWIRQRANMVRVQVVYVTLLLTFFSAELTIHLFTKTYARCFD